MNRHAQNKSISQIKILKEVGYILLLITFFVGIIVGSFSLKGVDASSFEENTEYLKELLSDSKGDIIDSKMALNSGLKTICIFWIVGLSIIGTPILIGYLGYKGYSLGYTISSIIRLLGVKTGNSFVFKYLFFNNAVLVFIMIFLANFSIKISKNFFENRTNLKPDAVKFSIIVGFSVIAWILLEILEGIL